MSAGTITGEGLLAIDREMARQHDDALASYAAAAELGARIAAALRQRRRMVLLGMGGSHAVNRMVEAEYRALGIQAFALTLSEQLYSPLDLSDAVVIVTSQSGESAEVHRILADLAGHAACFGMTLEANSTLGRSLPSLIGAGGTDTLGLRTKTTSRAPYGTSSRYTARSTVSLSPRPFDTKPITAPSSDAGRVASRWRAAGSGPLVGSSPINGVCSLIAPLLVAR